MAFMDPEYDNGPFEVYEDSRGERIVVPAGTLSASDLDEQDLSLVDHTNGKWWYRLSASGYMDCTDWCGPFDTEEDARADLVDTYEVDPDTGDDLEDETEDETA